MENIKSLAKVFCWALLLSTCVLFLKPEEAEYQADEIEMTRLEVLHNGGVKIIGKLIAGLGSRMVNQEF